ncbi:hypothetical protein QZH41_004934 [Actinostola sp. cb2023]|nr:hypothetical protein QZH41_004934 [Actinostola sp. cb2023]
MNGRMDEWTNGRMDEWTNGRMDEWTNGRMDEWTNGRMGEWTNGRMDEWMNGRVDEWTNGRMDEWTEWTHVLSCKDILSKTSYRKDMAYTLLIDNKQTDIYCHLSSNHCGSGGWTLAMKIDGSKTAQFGYSSSLWSNKESYNLTAGQTGFDNYQTKMPSYWAMPFQKLCVGLKVGSRDDSFGTFTIQHPGNVRAFKLVHDSGGVSYMGPNNQGNWGCTLFGSTSNEIVITNSSNIVVAPPPEKTVFQMLFGLMSYSLPGQTNMSPVLLFPDFEPPLKVVKNQEFRIWFGQDLTNTLEGDNYGTTCAMVYVFLPKRH